ncbi:norsolorinic acid reductase-like [Lingula anatina]|uniref:Norsolorinic acid reductase-like n=1 Tax=Lingula anatina TaxID=7574 RepID=A0A1S3KFB6_LINAN|nr:norsolorinic acid reductase-like [Lingula anatina]|eukprot:XP_013421149.1 norsolorinic acid reductase-like [Lingula anatina]
MDGSSMGYNFLGSSGLKVSNICMGTMTFGEHKGGRPGNLDEAAAHAMMDRFAELGGNFLDTADIYQRGESEEIVGTWLQKQDREKFVVATKVFAHVYLNNLNGVGLGRKHIMHAVEQSLKRLQTDYIDLYQV